MQTAATALIFQNSTELQKSDNLKLEQEFFADVDDFEEQLDHENGHVAAPIEPIVRLQYLPSEIEQIERAVRFSVGLICDLKRGQDSTDIAKRLESVLVEAATGILNREHPKRIVNYLLERTMRDDDEFERLRNFRSIKQILGEETYGSLLKEFLEEHKSNHPRFTARSNELYRRDEIEQLSRSVSQRIQQSFLSGEPTLNNSRLFADLEMAFFAAVSGQPTEIIQQALRCSAQS